MEKDLTVFKIVEEDGHLMMLFEKDAFQDLGLQPGSYVLLEKQDGDTYLIRHIGIKKD